MYHPLQSSDCELTHPVESPAGAVGSSDSHVESVLSVATLAVERPARTEVRR